MDRNYISINDRFRQAYTVDLSNFVNKLLNDDNKKYPFYFLLKCILVVYEIKKK